MESRGLRILLIGIFSLWFGVIVPGHERGAIRVAGAGSSHCPGDAVANSCHIAEPVPAPSCNHCPTQSPVEPDKAPAGDPVQHCAICKFIGVLDAPVMITFDLPQSYELAVLEPVPLKAIASISILSIDRGRGPPAYFM